MKVLPKMWKYDKSIYMLFIDFKKVYDSIHRESLVSVLKEFEKEKWVMPQKLININKMGIKHTDIRVKIGYSTSNAVHVTTGLRLDDDLFPILFNITLEK